MNHGTVNLLLRNRLAATGIALLLLVLVFSLMANWLPLADPDLTDPVNRLKRPFAGYGLLGTDHLGRDLLSRLLHGTRLSLAVGVTAAIIAALIGSAIGITAGYYGSYTDMLLMRGIDMLMAFPYILLALAIVAVLGPGLLNALYAVAIVNIPFFARNVRGIALGIKSKEFIDAARLNGRNHAGIIFFEVLPNVMPVIVVTLSTTIGWMILETAGLSFLGLGSQPPTADLGSMLGEGRKLLINAPHVSLVPGVMIFILVMAINLVGDGVRDALDPRLRSGVASRSKPITEIRRTSIPPRSDSSALLQVNTLQVAFERNQRRYQSVRGVTLQITPGECLGIVGESGSGKSVTALSLFGLLASPPGIIESGSVYFNDDEVLSLSLDRMRALRGGRVAYVFQDPLATLHPFQRIGDQLMEALRCHQPLSAGQVRNKALALLEQVRIPAAADRMSAYPHELSGGMRQRVGIAMALANDPELLIADEPTTALDVTIQAEILSLLAELRHERQLAVIFITHDFGVVADLCDRIAVMYAGCIVETGTTRDILNTPRHPYTSRLIDCIPQLGAGSKRLITIPGIPATPDAIPAGCAFAPRCDRATDDCRANAIPRQQIEGTSVVCHHPLRPEGQLV